ncbi:NTP transferase domain-containing protein [candidate division WOR-3 bacterium]|nr:NTP transferase domain-containing protein [candidate division WOR-3 bacterium]
MKLRKGVILAGGMGTRLAPLTQVTNKHLLPIYDKPMILYPIEKMVEAGIEEILLVTGGEFAGDFLKFLGNGMSWGIKRLHYTYQEGHGGIAEALSLARDFSAEEPMIVILGDNIFSAALLPYIKKYEEIGTGAMILLKQVKDAHRFGVACVQGKNIIKIVEKPAKPESNLAVTGIYFYDKRVFEIIDGLSPSARNEFEITDVNNTYIRWAQMRWAKLPGWWTDAGTFESLHRATELVRKVRTRSIPPKKPNGNA